MAVRTKGRRRVIATGFLIMLVASLAAGFVVLAVLSPGHPRPLTDSEGNGIPGSLSERTTVDIGGVPQTMIIQSQDPSNPVILFLHGGPGMPQFFMQRAYPTGLERDFTMVWWEQRGAGMSYSRDIPDDTMTVSQLIADTIEVADYLRERFGQDRIVLLGHSWGSFLGIQVAQAAPDRFLAYVGMGQVSHQLRSEVLAHDYMMSAYEDLGNTRMVARLAAAPVTMQDGLSPEYMRLRDSAMHRLGVGTTRQMRSVISGVFRPVWLTRAYTLQDKVNVWLGMRRSRSFLWDEFLQTDLSQRITRLDIPVYFFIGTDDLTANRDLSRTFFDQISAPVKGFYLFTGSAHSPIFEEPARARDILVHDVVTGTNALADAP